MAQFKEIEIKWDASQVDRTVFNKAVRSFIKRKYKSRFIQVSGFDCYYTSKNGEVARHRFGAETNELTVKSRLSKKSTTIRKEINLHLAKQTSQLDVQEAMGELGFKKVMPIFKDCDIYLIKDDKYTVDVVWYTVSNGKKGGKRIFMEVEVHNAPVKKSLALLKKWTKFIESLGVTSEDVIHDSLYEIYSGQKYKMVSK